MLEGKQRQIGCDDDDGGEEDGTGHFAGTLFHVASGKLQLGMPLAFLEDILHHHDGAVHQDAEVDGAERQQVSGNARQFHQYKGYQQCHRNRDGHHQRTTKIAQENHQHHHYQQHADKQGVGDGLECLAHEAGAVEERMDDHALR